MYDIYLIKCTHIYMYIYVCAFIIHLIRSLSLAQVLLAGLGQCLPAMTARQLAVPKAARLWYNLLAHAAEVAPAQLAELPGAATHSHPSPYPPPPPLLFPARLLAL